MRRSIKFILTTAVVSALIIGAAVSTFAAGSKSAGTKVPDEENYLVYSMDEAKPTDFFTEEDIEMFKKINSGKLTKEELADIIEKDNETEEDENIKKKQVEVIAYLRDDKTMFVTGFDGLKWKDGAVKERKENKKYKISLSNPAYTEDTSKKNPTFIHKSAVINEEGKYTDSYFELVKPDGFEKDNKIYKLSLDELEFTIALASDKEISE